MLKVDFFKVGVFVINLGNVGKIGTSDCHISCQLFRASDFPFQKKQFSVSKKGKFRFNSVSLLPKLNLMKSQYIQKIIP